jgi:hypothetical protein
MGDKVEERLPWFIAAVIAMSFLLLMVLSGRCSSR